MRFTYVLAPSVALTLLASAALADSCRITTEDSGGTHVQCQEYGSKLQVPMGGASVAEKACRQFGEDEAKETMDGKAFKAEFSKDGCPRSNVLLRCGVMEDNGEFAVVSYFYKGSTYARKPEDVCAQMGGKVL